MVGWTLIRMAVCGATVAVALTQGAPALPDNYFPPLSHDAGTVWNQYLWLTEQRIDSELADPAKFLALDFTPKAVSERQAVLDGQMPVAEMTTLYPNHTVINVPDNWVHHWRGAVLLRGAKLDQVLTRLKEAIPGTGQADVVKSAILSKYKDGTGMRTYLQVQRIGTTYHLIYNTEHAVTFTRQTPTKATSRTVATKIAELDNWQSGVEREFPAGKDNGFLRRWNSYWRYQEVGAGVVAECETITLSKDVPWYYSVLGAHGIAGSAASEAMTRALVNLQVFFRTLPAPSPAR